MSSEQISPTLNRPTSPLKIVLLVLATVVVSVLITTWLFTKVLFPKQFSPVTLDADEAVVLDEKLARFQGFQGQGEQGQGGQDKARLGTSDTSLQPLKPEAYTEAGANRSLSLSERELNAILAKNTDLADKLAIDLAADLVSARLRLPMDPDFPFFGGKILRARAGISLSLQNDRPVVVLKGVSVMGVPVPNAWLGGLKNIDLVSEFGQSEGFWKQFADGVDSISVEDGELNITLKE